MQYKYANFIHSLFLGAGLTTYITSVTLLILVNERSLFVWGGLGIGGVISVIAGYMLVTTDKYVTFKESKKMLPTIVFSMGCVLIPVLTLLATYGG